MTAKLAYDFGRGLALAMDAASARGLMQLDDQILAKLGGGGAGSSAHTTANKNWDKYKQMVAAAVSGTVPKDVWEEVEDQNYHTIVKALSELGKLGR